MIAVLYLNLADAIAFRYGMSLGLGWLNAYF